MKTIYYDDSADLGLICEKKVAVWDTGHKVMPTHLI